MRASLVRQLTAVGAALALFSGAAETAFAGTTRGYVVGYFIPAMYTVSNDECPHGKNPDSTKQLERILKDEGKSEEEVKAGTDADTLDMYKYGQLSTFRGQVDGKPADIYLHPLSHPELMELLVSKHAIGFNLDGTDGPDKFTDPLTGETGINNQLTRILGCFDRNRGTPESRVKNGGKWGSLAWLIAVNGADSLQNSENVEVRIYRALQTVTDGLGGVQKNVTYTVDSTAARMQNNVYHGRIKDRLFVSNEPVDFFMMNSGEYNNGGGGGGGDDDFKRSHLRLMFKPDGTVMGFLGGFRSIKVIYSELSRSRGIGEFGGTSFPAYYQSMLKLADTDIDKDPESGMRTRISATYQIGAVPAFLRFLNKFHTS